MHGDRDETIRAKIKDFGRESFPDGPDVEWQVRRTVHADNYSFVEAEPTAVSVDYPQVMFVLSFATAAPPAVVGCYGLDRGLWRLLFTAPDVPSDWVGLFPAETSEGFEADLLPLLQQGKKVGAIKVYRQKTGAGLREAKDAVEALAGKHGLALPKASCAGVIVLLSAVLGCSVFLFASTASPQSERKGAQEKKLIEWGWDEPDTKFIRQNVAQMEQLRRVLSGRRT